MSTTNRAIAVAVFAAAALLGQVKQSNGQGREPQRNEVRGILKAVDTAKATITISLGGGRDVAAEDKTYGLVKNVEIALGSGGFGNGGFGRTGLFKEGKPADLTSGSPVSLTLSADQKSVESILIEPRTVRGIVKTVDAAKKTLTISRSLGREPAEENTYTVAAKAEIAIDDGRGRRFSIKEGSLADLAEGAIVSLTLSQDGKQVQSLLATGGFIQGTLKAIDPAAKTMTLVVSPPRGDDAGEEKSLTLAPDAAVLLDDGKGRRLSLKEGKLTDVPTGAAVTVMMSVNQATVTLVRVEGPMVFGQFKAADADKGTITLAIPKGRDEPEEKAFTLAKDARILLDGKESKLADLKPGDNGLFIQLRLSLDQKMVQSIQAHQPRPR